MATQSLIFSFFLIFSGATLLATVALYLRQPILLAYITLGVLLGPFGLAWVNDTQLLADISHTGIIFLLFLIGLDMQPSYLLHMLRQGILVAAASSILFAMLGFCIAKVVGYSLTEALIIGATTMFSSTIIGIKLLPTTVLHHKKTGELVVGLLLLQDLIAIILLIMLHTMGNPSGMAGDLWCSLLALPLLIVVAFSMVKYLLLPLISRYDKFHEYIFLLAVGWCLGVAELGLFMGLSAEIGAFIAGISLAASPISQYIAINLKPIRDFFLVLFFFSIGAQFNLNLLGIVWFDSLVLAVMILLLKPAIFKWLIQPLCPDIHTAWEVGFRLGQSSEFSILIGTLALSTMVISETAAMMIQTSTILTFIISSYIVVWNFKSPIAIQDHLRRD
jgi:Kef-type K+ transport system membrane component KefB